MNVNNELEVWLLPVYLATPAYKPDNSRETIEAAGLKITGTCGLFFEVESVEGWTVEKYDPMWTYYYDASGTKRFGAFYKNEAWDKRAALHVY